MAERNETAGHEGTVEREPATDASPAEPSPSDAPSRPAPQFGEYAPEGWSWTPDGASAPADSGGGGVSAPGSAAAAPSSGRVPGVPHNLGAGGTLGSPHADRAPVSQATASASEIRANDGAPDRHYRGQPQQGARGPRRGDRIVTIVLLVLGAFGALYFAASLQQLPDSLTLLAAALEVDGFTVPASVHTLGTVGALTVFGIYALNLIYSIQRMRRHKLTFWVPLVAGVVAFIVVFAFTAFALGQVPELAKHFADPNSSSKLLDYLAGMSSSTP